MTPSELPRLPGCGESRGGLGIRRPEGRRDAAMLRDDDRETRRAALERGRVKAAVSCLSALRAKVLNCRKRWLCRTHTEFSGRGGEAVASAATGSQFRQQPMAVLVSLMVCAIVLVLDLE